ncbi:histidine phosphatase family protein [Anoxybacillus ayderensis]|jgi:probable phosphoglycerate mutase|uniref:histidine phosphatase family protein n=1 Tax=Anoxybacillus ayderensis TaxID=265546 RepID=UPI000A26F2C6|nr:histidine phosphatase family protein [Anoxybacillus ayderensis]MBA2878213.1 putative phosphoglycerate mutase [Anoxybacillus ayderensis]MED0658012.1 histidine phosphatase family protein [Anoxybacillus ayderensis]OSX54860.1 histidine phosphatase family protein [Anoxybacillus ayderensis]
MLKLYVIRHAETEWNAQQRMQGWKDSSLTETGRKHATLLQERLRTVPFTALYCSPSDRTKETAQIVLGQRDVPMYFDERLREIHLGHWEGKTIAEIAQTDERNHYYFYHEPHAYNPIVGETFLDVQRRAVAAIQHIVDTHSEGHILVVTHGVVIRTLLVYWKQQPLAQLWENSRVYGTSVTIVSFDGKQWTLECESNISHLEGEMIRG